MTDQRPQPSADTPAGSAGHSTVSSPPPAAHTADLAGLLAFLAWVHQHAPVFGRRPATVAAYRSAWHVAHKRLSLPAHAPVDDVDLGTLANRIIAGSPATKRTPQDYREKLAICRRWHQRWRAGETDWWRTPSTRPPVPRPATLIHLFPLRPGMAITVELPADLRPEEADLLHAWLRTLSTA